MKVFIKIFFVVGGLFLLTIIALALYGLIFNAKDTEYTWTEFVVMVSMVPAFVLVCLAMRLMVALVERVVGRRF